ncbi:MAG: protein translocase subunit SecD [Acidobacteriia bacterium]|nr:protein translocase subunit SecD [Terriglobia bacterium]
MQKNLRWKFLFITAIMLVSLWYFLSPKTWGTDKWLSRINLGLDLKGGMHLVLQVVTSDALNQELAQDAERIASAFKDKNITFDSAKKGNGLNVEIKGISPAQEKDAYDYLNQTYKTKYNIHSMLVNGKTDYSLAMMASVVRDMQESTVKQALETIRRRIDALGVTEPTLQIYGTGGSNVDDQLIVELPGIDDFERVKDLLKDTAQLTLCMVKRDNGGPYPSIEAAIQANGGRISDDYRIMPFRDQSNDPGTVSYLVVSAVPTITGKDLKNARRGNDASGRPNIDFFLNSAGAEIFRNATSQHIGDRLAIVIDDAVISAPTIQNVIGAEGQITGSFTVQEAEDLALVLRSGALPASLKTLEENVVGASLGNDAIRAGITAAIIGFGLVMIGMVVYYKHAGLNSVWCLFGNLIILLGFMGGVGATLTLPGIAGVILTIGMAVDSNILIFERIREELRNGKTIRAAVDTGFGKVFWTIFDTHSTSLIAAAFLFQFGTGPIRGFAITLTVGLLANMFTAVYVSHRLFDLTLSRRKVESLSI